jgi:hypothetical protein
VADITVQVSSAGLTAYGASTWGSQSFGGDNITNVSIGSVDAFYPDEGWGGYYWGYLVWGQHFINDTAAVTTPGTPTTWGQSTYGNYSWQQIVGIQSEIGDESIFNEENGIAFLSTNLLTLTITSLTITGDSNLSLNTNLLNIEEGFAQENVNANTIVEVNAPGNLPWGAAYWGSGSWGNIGGMFISQGAEEEVVPSIDVFVSTNLLTLTLTSIAQVTADANITANTNLLTVGLGNEDAVPNTIVSVSTNLLNVSVGIASGEFESTVSPTGVSATAFTGRLYISAWAVVNIGVTNAWSVVDIAA